MEGSVNFSPNALIVLKKRYLKKDSKGNPIETPAQMLERVSSAIASAEEKYNVDDTAVKKMQEEFYNMMADFSFMPNSPTLMNAGRDLGQLSACFVVPVEDSMDSIFDAIKSTALIHKTGGGTGFSFSKLRSSNSVVRTTGGVASGPISFMKVFDSATQAVKQGGTRRGANMGILRVDHPDILEFIKCKSVEGQISNFNISVAVTNSFMEAVFKDTDYELVDPKTKEVVKKLRAKEVFNLIAEYAHNNGEPGIVFIDKMNEENPTPHLGNVESTNPCGEQPLLAYESCNLGSINLARMLKQTDEGKLTIDWEKLRKTTRTATRFLDNVIDVNKFPLPQIKENTCKTRKIGLGVMGWATLLGYLEIPYNSEEAIELAKRIMEYVHEHAQKESVVLGRDRGVFPAWKRSIWEKRGVKVRNATLTTVAPTGTISIIAGPTSSGIEPLFSLAYFRNILDGERLLDVDPAFEYVAKKRGFYSKELMEKIASGESIQKMEEVPESVKKVFVTSMEIDYKWHIKMQAAFQEHTDNAVSKTINLHNSASIDDVKESYITAYKVGCKGLTVYRDGSRSIQVLTVDKKKEENKEIPSIQAAVIPAPRPRGEVMCGTTTKVATGCGNLYITINQDLTGNLFEVFTQMGKTGGCAASQLEAIGRLVSLSLRGGIDPKIVIEQLRGIRCPSPSWAKGEKIFSCADALSRVLERRVIDHKDLIKEAVPEKADDTEDVTTKPVTQVVVAKKTKIKYKTIVGVCPDCGSALRHQEGCMLCDACGYSKC